MGMILVKARGPIADHQEGVFGSKRSSRLTQSGLYGKSRRTAEGGFGIDQEEGISSREGSGHFSPSRVGCLEF